MDTGALAGKAVVVIGGTTGLGLSGAAACAGAGARIVAVGLDEQSCRSAEKALAGICDRPLVFAGDAAQPETAARAIERCVEQHGRFDALYHVAGGSGRKFGDGPLHEITDAGWNATLSLNLTSLFNSNRSAVKQFLKQGTGGVILNLSSVLAFSPSPEFFATHAYAAAKAAILGLTKSCAAYYADRNIRFNALCPGLVDTPMAKRAAGDQTILDFIHSKQPLDGGRIGKPEDLDAAVVFLLSDQSRFVTGQILRVDGGWSVSEGQIPDTQPRSKP